MAKKMKAIAIVSVLMTIIWTVLYFCIDKGFALSLAITFGTISYHFVMRLIVGTVINLLLHNRVDYKARWFRVRDREQKLYKKLKVKKWKSKMPTYDVSGFDPRTHAWDEIAQAMCQAELVHEIIVILSFVPIVAAIPFGAAAVFIITSILAAGFDALFVLMQRYNRARIIKMI